MPAASRVDELEVRAFGEAFAGARLDIGTRALLAALDAAPRSRRRQQRGPWIDLACGTGIVGAWLARRHPSAYVYASDQSAAAVASAQATAAATAWAIACTSPAPTGWRSAPDASASFIALNPRSIPVRR
jgi:16S rRNA (guanine1207-N2)-methyltransferase